MMLHQIMDNFKEKSWPRLCTLHKIDKWDIIAISKKPVFSSKLFIGKAPPISTKLCHHCYTQFDLGIYKGNYIAKKNCQCGHDGTNQMTLQKLTCFYSISTANDIINSVNLAKRQGLQNTIEYWVSKGYSAVAALSKTKEVQKDRSLKSPAAKKGARGYSIRTVEYWIKKGLTHEEATLKVSKVQVTNGLDFYTSKYGSNGKEMFNARIRQWLDSPGNKRMVANRSKKSIELFKQLEIGYYGPDEKTVRGKQKVHRVDFLYGKKIIEYYGDYWHGNPKIYTGNEMIRKKKVNDVWLHDSKKVRDLEDNDYTVMIVWENDYISSPVEILQKCRDFIK